MATAVHNNADTKANAAYSETSEFIPEIIEEKRKDVDGKSIFIKYARGKLLGKVGFFS